MEFTEASMFRVRLLIGGVLIIAALLLLPFMLSVILANPKAHAEQRADLDNPNIITNGMVSAVGGAEQITSSAAEIAESSLRMTAGSIIAASVAGGKVLGHGVYSGSALAAESISGGFSLIARTTGNVTGTIANTSPISLMIRPSENVPVPVIETELYASEGRYRGPVTETPRPAPPVPEAISAAQWPMTGNITTKFGVRHWPYQPYHTGIDISDGQRSGVTPIRPFKPGKVTVAVSSRSGLGNHIVIDHGGGMTSVYAHLSTISVKSGQDVGNSATLGYAGSTGVSTGTHLHLEVKINGKPVNPLQFING